MALEGQIKDEMSKRLEVENILASPKGSKLTPLKKGLPISTRKSSYGGGYSNFHTEITMQGNLQGLKLREGSYPTRFTLPTKL